MLQKSGHLAGSGWVWQATEKGMSVCLAERLSHGKVCPGSTVEASPLREARAGASRISPFSPVPRLIDSGTLRSFLDAFLVKQSSLSR